MRQTTLARLAATLGLTLLASSAQADVAPEPPVTWSATLTRIEREPSRMTAVITVTNQASRPLALQITTERFFPGAGAPRDPQASSVRVGDRELPIETAQAGPRMVRIAGPFTVPASGTATLEIRYEAEGTLDTRRIFGVDIHEAADWRGVSIRYDRPPAPAPSPARGSADPSPARGSAAPATTAEARIAAPADGGGLCACVAPGAGAASLPPLLLLGALLLWRRRG